MPITRNGSIVSQQPSSTLQTPTTLRESSDFLSLANVHHIIDPQDRLVDAIRNRNQCQILIITDGACSNNGKSGAIAGCAFVFKGGELSDEIKACATSFRLEECSPTGIAHPHTSYHAELCAVIAALQFRAWDGEGYNKLVIATDSDYVENDATQGKEKWRKSAGKEVQRRDLCSLRRYNALGRDPARRAMFWRNPRQLSRVADQAAKEAAATSKINGVLI